MNFDNATKIKKQNHNYTLEEFGINEKNINIYICFFIFC